MSNSRRRWLSRWPLFGAALSAGVAVAAATPTTGTAPNRAPSKEPRMPGDPPEHRIVYQLNRADPEYIEHVLGSVGALIGKYEDNVSVVVVAFGPGIHLLALEPRRPVPMSLTERARGQARDYGVRFVACGNTMKTYAWTAKDMLPFVQIEEVGAATLMELQEQGYAYLAW
jgi:intracellular sulfur oxidation DsrE/DsrF family protein